MSVDSYIPELWSAEILVPLTESRVLAGEAFVNRDYEGDIARGGASVKINSIGAVSTAAYSGTTMTPEDVSLTDQSLVINEARQYGLKVDDIDARQAAGDFRTEALTEAARALGEWQDGVAAAAMTAAATSIGNFSANVVDPDGATKGTAYNVVRKLAVAADKNSTPRIGRALAVDAEFHGLLLADSRFVASSTDVALQTGSVGRILGFDVYVTSSVSTSGTVCTAIATHPIATTLADNLVENEALRNPNSFGDILRGLLVCGVKVTRAKHVSKAVVTYVTTDPTP